MTDTAAQCTERTFYGFYPVYCRVYTSKVFALWALITRLQGFVRVAGTSTHKLLHCEVYETHQCTGAGRCLDAHNTESVHIHIYIAIYCNVHTTTYNEISSRFCCARQPRRCVQKNDNTQRKHKNQLLQPHKGKGNALLSQHWNISKIRRQTTHSQARTHESRLANRDQPPIKKLCSATGQLL